MDHNYTDRLHIGFFIDKKVTKIFSKNDTKFFKRRHFVIFYSISIKVVHSITTLLLNRKLFGFFVSDDFYGLWKSRQRGSCFVHWLTLCRVLLQDMHYIICRFFINFFKVP